MAVYDPLLAAVEAVRHFNRFYTNRIGLLAEGLLNSPFSITEARVLYELANRDGLTATEIGRDLGLDAGYLSRILKAFARQRLVARRTSDRDARQRVLTLTAAGHEAFTPLNEGSRAQIGEMLREFGETDREALVAAMRTIERVLGKDGPASDGTLSLRPPRLGDIGWIIHRQALLYQREYGWNQEFEVLLAEIFAAMMKDFTPDRDAGWVVELDGRIVGSVFVVRQSETVAKLRLLYIEPEARGRGLGRRLVMDCIAFARARGYRRLTLWTNDVLVPARRIYAAAGFRLTSAEPVHAFGHDMVSETWDLDL
ncbi:MAG TPA: helix-turn-helix domain-containing GNAT family N-acetyltransferase [Rhodopila sp.]|uniref:bifunctional helix-turn-helix transcriptional regulator/GNAT family N-acetyltransferase n=1 Tax=Rhodopila sp. TaxID=2480087 RepID=UPI002C2C0CFA|nr:helix-turn-helix domain-containing GNAT family N-acetyltransferase [Rhodopila sp.]HVY14166.1 helix-turn-helix domain-containing GNAT family N-acetyltransferase [Rhodopila sp.]